jgi:TetR/AcrR family transcriptional repressor of nem operon
MKQPTSKAEHTRNFIIETTAGIFNKQGYAGTSMSDLTFATGLTKGSIYGNFENKEAVALAAFDYNYAKIAQAVADEIGKAENYHDKLMAYARVYKNVIRGMSKGGCPILNTATEADDTNGPLRDKAAHVVIRWERNVSHLIQQGITTGEFKTDVNVRQTALSIIALIEGGVMISKVTGDSTAMDAILTTAEMLISQLKK